MTRDTRETVRNRLLGLREGLLDEIRRKNDEAARLTDEGVPDVADLGVTDNLKEFLHLLSDSKREELLRIDDALERLENGAYGFCQECEEPIAPERLKVRPHTRYCISCKEKLEGEEERKSAPGKGQL